MEWAAGERARRTASDAATRLKMSTTCRSAATAAWPIAACRQQQQQRQPDTQPGRCRLGFVKSGHSTCVVRRHMLCGPTLPLPTAPPPATGGTANVRPLAGPPPRGVAAVSPLAVHNPR